MAVVRREGAAPGSNCSVALDLAWEHLVRTGLPLRDRAEAWADLQALRVTYADELERLIDFLVAPRGFWGHSAEETVDQEVAAAADEAGRARSRRHGGATPPLLSEADMGRTRVDLHRLSAHVLGRRRVAVSGHFGLRASPGGLGTPAFGPEPETLRLTSASLIREVGTESRRRALAGATLAELADFAGADLGVDFSAGPGTPALGRIDEPLELDVKELDELFSWFDLGWRVLDQVMAERPGPGRPGHGAAVAGALRRRHHARPWRR